MQKISFLFFLLYLLNTILFASSKEGKLTVNVTGFENNKGKLIIQILRKEDNIFDNKPYLQSKDKIHKQKGQIIFQKRYYYILG